MIYYVKNKCHDFKKCQKSRKKSVFDQKIAFLTMKKEFPDDGFIIIIVPQKISHGKDTKIARFANGNQKLELFM